jgi:cephalosporin hydroxylase
MFKLESARDIVDKFHLLYFDNPKMTWQNTYWLRVPAQKYPLDLWIYQVIIYEIRPDIIVECGTAQGGAALFMASICDLVGNGKVITIDIAEDTNRPQHKRIVYLTGSSLHAEIVERVRREICNGDKVIVFLNSCHAKSHVLGELKVYSRFVTVASYVVVEDTSVNGHPILPDFGPDLMEAVDEFLAENSNSVVDVSRQKFFLTFNPKGYLKKINNL